MMSTISNDKQFRDALNGLNAQQQRLVGALFVENVLGLSNDPRVAQSLVVAKGTDLAEDVVNLARRSIKAA
jgi:hypothetical protein